MHEAFRALRRDRGVSLIAILTFGSAIGASIVALAAANALFLRPLSVREPDRLVVLWEEDLQQDGHLVEVSFRNFTDWTARAASFESMAAMGFHDWGMVLLREGEPERIPYRAVAASFFDTLGAAPLLGRTFIAADDEPEAERVVVLSHGLWQRRFGEARDVVGRALTFETGDGEELFTVVGVMPREFQFPAGSEAWAPAGREIASIQKRGGFSDETMRWIGVFSVIGRLRPGVASEQAKAEMDAITGSLAATIDRRHGVVITPFTEFLFGRVRIAVLAFLGAVALIVLIACANVSNLLAFRAVGRRRAFEIRRALGASRASIARLLLAEGLFLSLGGLGLGILMAPASLGAITALAPVNIPQLSEMVIDVPVVAFAALLAVAAGLVSSVLPILAIEKRHFETRGALVVLQTALVVVVLAGAGLAGKSFFRLLHTDLGFEPKGTLSFVASPSPVRYADDEKRRAFYRDLLHGLEGLPGVEAAGAVLVRPYRLGAIGQDAFVQIEGQSKAEREKNPTVNWQVATPGYFRAMGIRVLSGRGFETSDDERTEPVAVVGESLARRMWPGEDPVGRRLSTLGLAPLDDAKPPWATVVGVVEDVRYRELDRARPNLYVSYLQVDSPPGGLTYVVRTGSEPHLLTGPVAAALHSLDPEEPLDGVASMEDVVREAGAPWRFTAALLSSFAFVAIALTALGIFSVFSRSVSERKRELGVRIAIGARADHILRLVLGRALLFCLLGIGLGLAAAWPSATLMRSILFDVQPTDPAVFLGAAAFALTVGIAAAFVPARIAAATDPSQVLRAE